jgi:tRNA dimethylallyltransferase
VALVGTTASGKSAIAMAAARSTGVVEIVSVDSMAVYREMDLGTAKPSTADRTEVPHHLIDVLDPAEECSVSLFRTLADEAISKIRTQAKVPVLVGGTGLYHRSVIDQLEFPPQFPAIRCRLEAEMDDPARLAEAYGELERIDPEAATRIEPTNVRRIVRALEVHEGTGRPFSSFGPGLKAYPTSSVLQIGVIVDQAVSDQAIDRRVEAWMDAGLLDEVRSLTSRTGGLSRTARQAIGYRELFEVVEDGADLDEAIEVTKQRTRAFARRQRSWFRRDPRISWVRPEEALAAVVEAVGRVRAGLEVGE